MRSNQPAQSTFDKHHAVVIGGGVAGLLAARVLSDHFAHVTMIERDQLINDAEARKGVPQGRHVHALLARGAIIMGEYFPDLFPTLARNGAILVSTRDVRWNQLGLWMAPVTSHAKTSFQSRPFLEQHVRDQLAARDNVRIIDACEVSQLCVHNDRITSVVLRYRTGERHEEALSADLVVDASGRGSRAPQWHNLLGYGHVRETSVKIDIGYATRIYRCPAQLPANWKAQFIYRNPPTANAGESSCPSKAASGWSRWQARCAIINRTTRLDSWNSLAAWLSRTSFQEPVTRTCYKCAIGGPCGYERTLCTRMARRNGKCWLHRV